jgi:hypothetical protein
MAVNVMPILLTVVVACAAAHDSSCGRAGEFCRPVNDATLMLQQSQQGNERGVQAVLAAGPPTTPESAEKSELTKIAATAVPEKTLEPQQLLFCNAFVSKLGMTGTLRRTGQQLAVMPYKACVTAEAEFEIGDHFDFKAEAKHGSNETLLGSFVVKHLPAGAVHTLLLIIDRRPKGVVGSGDEASFISHAFETVTNDTAQVAIIDAFSADDSTEAATPADLHIQGEGEPMSMHFDGVATILSGRYTLSLAKTNLTFDAVNATNYVVLRVGGASAVADIVEFPEELVVFPNSFVDHKSGSLQTAQASSVLAFCLALFSGLF